MLAALVDDQLVLANQVTGSMKEFKCPKCLQPVVLKRGAVKFPYFSHQVNNRCSLNEGERHLTAKFKINEQINHLGWQSVTEKMVVANQQRADIYVEPIRVAVEYQYSPISLQAVRRRTSGYYSQNIRVFWVLGDSYLNQRVTFNLLARFAYYSNQLGMYVLFYSVIKDCWIVRFNFNECAGRINYQVREFNQLEELVQFSRQKQINRRVKMTVRHFLKQSQRIHHQLIKKDESIKELVTLFYQKQKILSAYPKIYQGDLALVAPLFKPHSLFWRLYIGWYLFEGGKLRFNRAELQLILKRSIAHFGVAFVQVPNYYQLVKQEFSAFLDELQRAGYIKMVSGDVIIIQAPQWFLNYDQKQNFYYKKRR